MPVKKNATLFVLLLFFFILIFLGMNGFFDKSGEIRTSSISSGYETLMEYDLDLNYPQNPFDVVELNNQILFCLYGGGIQEEEIAPVVQMQRILFSQELLAGNPEAGQLANVTEEITSLKQAGQRLLKSETGSPFFVTTEEEYCSIDVTQYTNTGINNYVRYFLIYEEGLWKIHSWEMLE